MEIRVARRYALGRKIQEDVYNGTDVANGSKVVIKLEPLRCCSRKLIDEAKILRILQGLGKLLVIH